MYQTQTQKINTIQLVAGYIGLKFGVNAGYILNQNPSATIPEPRRICIWLCMELLHDADLIGMIMGRSRQSIANTYLALSKQVDSKKLENCAQLEGYLIELKNISKSEAENH